MSKVYTHGEKAYIDGNFTLSRELFQKFQGFRKWKDGKLFFELSAANINEALKSIPLDDWIGDAHARAAEIIKFNQETSDLETLKARDFKNDDMMKVFPFVVKPYQHQFDAFQISKDKTKFAYFFEQQTGKTKTTIDVAAYQYSLNMIDTLVVVAPNGVHVQWIEDAIPEHMPKFVTYDAFIYKSGMGKGKRKEYEVLMQRTDCLRIVAMNAEALSHKSGQDFLTEVLAAGKCFLTIDESSRFRNASAERTKYLLSVSQNAVSIRILSGTPLVKGIENFYSQFGILDEDILGFTSFYTFRNRYCVMGGYENKEIVRYKNVDEFIKKIEPWSFRAVKKDCLDLPPIIKGIRYFDLTAEQRRIIKEIKEDLRTMVASGEEITMPLAITRIMKLQQVTSGFIIDENKNTHLIMPIEKNPRTNELLDVVRDTDEKILIWARFVEDARIIAKALWKNGIKYVVYNDEGEDRVIKKNKFKEDPSIQCFISNQRAGGIGLTIMESCYTVYYSNTSDAEDRWQSESRNYGAGQLKTVNQIDLVANNSGDKRILEVIAQRKELSDIVIDGKKLISNIIEDLEEA